MPLPTLDEAVGAVIADETRLRSLAVSHTTPLTHSGVLASQQRGNVRGSSPSSGVLCSHCKKSGHTVDQCFALHPELLIEFRKRHPGRQQYRAPARRSSTAAITEPDFPTKCASVSVASQSTSGDTPAWYLDSGASFHVTSDCSQLVSCQPVKEGASVQTADGTSCSVTHQGSLSSSKFSVPKISLVPWMSMNLMSVGQLADMNYFIVFDATSCYVQDRQSKQVIGTGRRRRGSSDLYVLDILHLPRASTPSIPTVTTSTPRASSVFSFTQWHHRLGHLCGSRLSTLVKQGVLGQVSSNADFNCKGCTLGKQIQLPYPLSTTRSSRPFDLIHSDV